MEALVARAGQAVARYTVAAVASSHEIACRIVAPPSPNVVCAYDAIQAPENAWLRAAIAVFFLNVVLHATWAVDIAMSTEKRSCMAGNLVLSLAVTAAAAFAPTDKPNTPEGFYEQLLYAYVPVVLRHLAGSGVL